MSFTRTACSWTRRIITHIPLELQIGVLTTGSLLLWLMFLVYSNKSELPVDLLSNFINYWMYTVALLGVVALCTFNQNVFLNMPNKFYDILSQLMFSTYVGVFIALYSLLIALVFMVADQTWAIQVSLMYLKIDLWLRIYEHVGWLVAFMSTQTWLHYSIAFAYSYTVFVLMAGLLVMILLSAAIARQFLMAVFISAIISTPLWVALPAIAPYQLAVSERLAESPLSDSMYRQTAPVVALYNSYNETKWSTTINDYVKFWEDGTKSYGYAVSSNPSMHIIWGLILTVYLWRLRRWLGIAGLIFTLVESMGTMLFLQHYLIDLPFGVLFGFLTIYTCDRLYAYEKKKVTVSKSLWFRPLAMVEQLRRRLVNGVENKLTDCRS